MCARSQKRTSGGAARRQPGGVAPALVAMATLAGAAIYGLWRDRGPATLNNVAFAMLHVSVLFCGAWPALRRPTEAAAERPAAGEQPARVAA